MNEILKKIDEMIHNTEELLNEFEKNERLEVKLRTLLIVREIIQSEQNITPCYVPSDCEYKENSNCSMGGPCCYQNKPQTKGHVIRESNESLAMFIYNITTNCITGKCLECKLYKVCEHEDNTGDIEDYLNQPVESEE